MIMKIMSMLTNNNNDDDNKTMHSSANSSPSADLWMPEGAAPSGRM